MTRLIRFTCALSLIAGATLPACSSSSDTGSSTSFSTGLPPTQSLGSVSDADAKQLCAAFASYAANAIPQSTACRAAGFSAAVFAHLLGSASTDAAVEKACTDTETACNNAPAAGGDAGQTQCTKPPASCTATVSQLEACMNDRKAAFSQAFAQVKACTSLTTKDVEPTDGGGRTTQPSPASCAPLETTACQGVVPQTMSSGSASSSGFAFDAGGFTN